MSTPEKTEPLYRMEHPAMLQFCKNTHGFFIQDKADFITFDADFSDPFGTEWLAEIMLAQTMPDDETVLDQQKQLTELVEEKMGLCRNKFQGSKYFIEKTFPGKKEIWNEFGYNDYEEARKSQVKMILFMEKFHTIAVKYAAKLIAKKYAQEKIDEIKNLGDELDAANLAQELFKGGRGVTSQDRQKQYNKIWEITTGTVCKAGKTIYTGNFAKYQRYLQPSEGGVSPVSGTLQPGATYHAADNVSDEHRFEVKNTGSTTLNLCRAATPAAACAGGIPLAAGNEATVSGAELGGAAGGNFNITNAGTENGSFVVRRV